MPLFITATVTVIDEPMTDEDAPDALVAFPVADAQGGAYAGQRLSIERLDIGQVVCRAALATAALARVHRGDRVIVVGQLRLLAPLDYPRDNYPYVTMSIEADMLGVAIG